MGQPIIHVVWEGPIALSDISKMTDDEKDFGLYQVYGGHPIYGHSTLIYIGKAEDRTFGQRIPEHKWDTGSESDPQNVQVYVGRLKGSATPSLAQWKREINLAEAILIHAHCPACNSHFIKEPPISDAHVLNWGASRSLQREVSCSAWAAGSEFHIYLASNIPTPDPLLQSN